MVSIRNILHRFMYLNTGSLVSIIVWGSFQTFGWWSFAGRNWSMGSGFERVYSLTPFPLLPFCFLCGHTCDLSASYTCCNNCTNDTNSIPLELHVNMNPFLLSVAFSYHFHQSSKRVTKTLAPMLSEG